MIGLDQGGSRRLTARRLPVPVGLARHVEEISIFKTGGSHRSGWRIVPDASAHVLWHCYENGHSSIVLVGARSRYLDIHPEGRTVSVGFRLRPGALAPLVRDSAWQLRDRGVSFSEVMGRRGLGFTAAVESGSTPDQVARRGAHALGRLLEPAPIDWRVAALLHRLELKPGSPVGDIARTLGVSERGLRSVTRECVGLRPKEAQRVLRLQSALGLTLDGTRDSVAARAAGYSDQSHYLRDSRALLGETPRQFSRRADSSKPHRATRSHIHSDTP